jgi:hypothetical protein
MAEDQDQQLTRLQSEIDALQLAIANLAALPHLQQPLKEQLADKEGQLTQLQTGGVNFGNAQIERINKVVGQDDVAGDKVGIKHEYHYGTADVPDHDTLLREYLGALGGVCNRLSLADADSSDPHRAAVELAAVFTRLEVASTVQLTDEDFRVRREQSGNVFEKTRQRTALEAVASAPRLVLLGAPGGGKSTLVNFLGLCLAHAWLGEDGWLGRLGAEWSAGALRSGAAQRRGAAAARRAG